MAKINNIEQKNERYQKYLPRSNSRKTIMKAQKTAKKVGKVALNQAPIIGGVTGIIAGGFLGGALDGNPNTVFDTTGAFSGGVAGTMMGAMWKQNHKNNLAEKYAKQQQMMLENSTNFRNISTTGNCELGYEELDESEANMEEMKMILQQRKIEIEKAKIQNEFQKQEQEMKQLIEQRNKNASLSTTTHPMSQDLIKQLSSLHMSLAPLIQNNPIPTSAITTASALNVMAVNQENIAPNKQEEQKPLINM